MHGNINGSDSLDKHAWDKERGNERSHVHGSEHGNVELERLRVRFAFSSPFWMRLKATYMQARILFLTFHQHVERPFKSGWSNFRPAMRGPRHRHRIGGRLSYPLGPTQDVGQVRRNFGEPARRRLSRQAVSPGRHSSFMLTAP